MTKNAMIQILLVEDSPEDAELIKRELKRTGILCDIKWADSKESFLKEFEDRCPNIILCDYKMPSFGALDALAIVKERCPLIPFIVVSGTVGEDIAVETLQMGATDYILKNRMQRLGPAIKRALEEAEELAKRKAAEEALKKAATEWQNTFDAISDPVMLLDGENRIARANKATIKLLNRPFHEILGRHCYELFHGTITQPDFCPLRKAVETKKFTQTEIYLPDRKVWLEISVDPMISADNTYLGAVHTIRDITKRKAAEDEIKRLTRTYAVLSKINQMMVHIREPQELYKTVCKIAVEEGLFAMSWIGLLDPDTSLVKPVVSCGLERGYINNISISVRGDIPEGRGPTGTAIREGKYDICNDIENDARMEPWRNAAQKGGYRSAAAFPIRLDDRVIGALSLYSTEPYFFNDEEIKLLEELADDVSFSIKSIEIEKERNASVERLKESEERLAAIFENAHEGILIADAETHNFILANELMHKMLGYMAEDITGMNIKDIHRPEDLPLALEMFEKLQKKEIDLAGDIPIKRKDGSVFYADITAATVAIGDRYYLAGFFRDITERKKAEERLCEDEAKYRTLIENIPQKIFLKDKNSVYISCNGNYARDLNIRPEEIAGKTDYEFYPKELAEKYRRDDKRVMESKQTEELEEEYISHGQKAFIHTFKTPVKDSSGDVNSILGIFEDITERKRAEAELKEKILDLERFHKVTIGREQRIIELKEEVKKLKEKLGEK
jgi:PAS domain S-box-containing protein